jgi:hypothetical protein
MLSAYDMYSTTYSSQAEYEEKAESRYWLVARFDDGTASECAIGASDAEALAALEEHASDWVRSNAALARCVREHRERASSQASLASVSVELRRIDIDWNEWRLAGMKTVSVAGPVHVGVDSP